MFFFLAVHGPFTRSDGEAHRFGLSTMCVYGVCVCVWLLFERPQIFQRVTEQNSNNAPFFILIVFFVMKEGGQ
jgi:hypothetical protein